MKERYRYYEHKECQTINGTTSELNVWCGNCKTSYYVRDSTEATFEEFKKQALIDHFLRSDWGWMRVN